jgi:putative oxidoreductase
MALNVNTTIMNTNKSQDFSLLITRTILGIVIAAHGTQKLFGWFGGYGFEGTMGYFTETIGLPYLIGALIILAESIGMFALVAGLLSRVMAGALIFIMLGAISAHVQNGFFMNWFGAQGGEGYEYHLLVIALSGVVLINGAGKFSVDYFLFKKLNYKLY